MESPDPIKRIGELELQEDFEFQKSSWRAQKCGQLAVLLLVIAGALGAFGGGVLGDERVRDASDELRIKHPRFARLQAPYEMRFEIASSLVRAGKATVWIESALLDSLEIESIMPQPESETLAGSRTLFHFAVTNPPIRVPIVFHMKTEQAGQAAGRAGVEDGPQVRIAHFIYP